jgi:hypothetical protein
MSPQRGDGIGGCLISFNATFPSRASTCSRFSVALLPLQLFDLARVVGLQRADLVAPPGSRSARQPPVPGSFRTNLLR